MGKTIHSLLVSGHKEHKFLGQNVTVAILDTGISPHPDFKGRILSFRDFSSTTGSSEKVLFLSLISPLSSTIVDTEPM